MYQRIFVLMFFTASAALPPAHAVAPAADAIAVIRAVGAEGEGNAQAREAWVVLTEADGAAIPAILEAMDGANALAANWLRSAVEAIADREKAAGGGPPLADLKAFLLDTAHDPEARALAFELIRAADGVAAEALVPGMLHDPSVTLRREAVQRLIGEGDALEESGKKPDAIGKFREALDAARDLDQIQQIAKSLRALGEQVDLPRHFGFLMHWHVVGPFDNTGRAGFDAVFPPEKGVDLSERYEGKSGEVSWVELVTGDEYGIVDFNKPFGMLKEATAYARATFESEEARDVELRLGSKNAWKVWVNGEMLFGRDEYHRGMRLDQYRIPATFKAGTNEILVKACQDHQTEEWTVEWQFQLRVCDATGTAVLAANRPSTPAPQEQTKERRRG